MLDTRVEGGQPGAFDVLRRLGRLLDGMQPQERSELVRGGRQYSTERVMAAMEARLQDYLFKLILRPMVKASVAQPASQEGR